MFQKLFNRSKKREFDLRDDYVAWRDFIFSVQSNQVGISDNQPQQVYGVVLDVGLANEDGSAPVKNMVITMTAFASGESSLKTSFGGGVFGLGDNNEVVATSAKHIIELAQALQVKTQPTSNFELPESGKVYFYFLTTSEIRKYACEIKDASVKGHLFNPIFALFTLIKNESDRIMGEINHQNPS